MESRALPSEAIHKIKSFAGNQCVNRVSAAPRRDHAAAPRRGHAASPL